MSAVNDIFVQSEACLLGSGHADTVVFLSGVCVGRVFEARIDLEGEIMFEPILGKDARESNMLRVLPANLPNYLEVKSGDYLAVVSFKTENGVKWKVVDRELNPATVTVDFKLERQNDVIKLILNQNKVGGYFLANSNGSFILDSRGNRIQLFL